MRVRFNPRLPGGRRQQTCCTGTCLTLVSIHAFRGEGDGLRGCNNVFVGEFQSTPSRGKATPSVAAITPSETCFNPRLPGGRRLIYRYPCSQRLRFQSTPSGGKATAGRASWELGTTVSIHAFRGEGDPLASTKRHNGFCFNPRLPGGRRRGAGFTGRAVCAFQSTPSGGKATW